MPRLLTGLLLTLILAAVGICDDHTSDTTSGSSFTLRVLPSKNPDGTKIPVTTKTLQQTIQTIKNRLNRIGVDDHLITAQGSDRILVQLPGITAEQHPKIRASIITPARLALKEVHPGSRTLADALAREKPEDRVLPPGYELNVLEYEDGDGDGQITKENLLIKRLPALDGSYIVLAQELYGPNEGNILVELNSEGTKKISDLTSKMRHGRDRLAIVLNGKVLRAPTVMDTLGSRLEIIGMKDAKEAKAIAAALLSPLKNPVKIIKEHTARAPLGNEE